MKEISKKIQVGFVGYNTLMIIGTASDMKLFFDTVDYVLPPKYPEKNWSILTDRLYRRYLKLEEIDIADDLMKLTEQEFKQTKSSVIDWEASKNLDIDTDLDTSQDTLYDLFAGYFRTFSKMMEHANYYRDKKREYSDPIKTGITTIPYCSSYGRIPLEYLDDLPDDADPIWFSLKIPI